MRILIFFTLLIWVTCAPVNFDTRDDNFDRAEESVGEPFYRAIENLTKKIVAGVESENKTSLAVIEFSNLDGSTSLFGQFFAEKLISQLFETRKFKVVERNLLNKILEEYKLSQAGITSPELAEQLGKLLGVEAIISGTITDVGGAFDVNSRIIDTQDGSLLSAATILVTKDEMVLNLINRELPDREKDTPKPESETPTVPSRAFTSAIEVDTHVNVYLDALLERVKNKHTINFENNHLVWEHLNDRNDIGYVFKTGKIVIFSDQPLVSQPDIEAFRVAYVTVADAIIEVNVDMTKDVRNTAWLNELKVYNYERNTYKRLSGYLRGAARIVVPRMNIKQITFFVFSDGWNNRIIIDGNKITQWQGRNSKTLDVTRYLYYGEHEIEIQQHGGTRPFFMLEFFVESSPLSIQMTNNKDLNLRDSVPCLSYQDLQLPY